MRTCTFRAAYNMTYFKYACARSLYINCFAAAAGFFFLLYGQLSMSSISSTTNLRTTTPTERIIAPNQPSLQAGCYGQIHSKSDHFKLPGLKPTTRAI